MAQLPLVRFFNDGASALDLVWCVRRLGTRWGTRVHARILSHYCNNACRHRPMQTMHDTECTVIVVRL